MIRRPKKTSSGRSKGASKPATARGVRTEKKSSGLTALDLFSGCGGLSLGLKKAGFSVVAAVDSEPLACSTYRKNHPDTLLVEQDIRLLDPNVLMLNLGLEEGELSLLAGCPPCQGFSRLRTLNGGKAATEPMNAMNNLVFDFLRFVKAFRPQAVMLENVPGLAQDSRLAHFRGALSAMGYKSCFDVFDAADFGVPQRRKRMILLAAQKAKPKFASPVEELLSVEETIGTLPRPEVSKDPVHNYPVTRAPQVMAIIRKIPIDGGNRMDLGPAAQLPCHRKCDGFSDIYGRMAWGKPSPTITGGCINPSKGRFLHPEQDRAITLREAALLQGFPADYQFDMSRGRYPAAQMIGNAFPPAFAACHARELRSIITGSSDH